MVTALLQFPIALVCYKRFRCYPCIALSCVITIVWVLCRIVAFCSNSISMIRGIMLMVRICVFVSISRFFSLSHGNPVIRFYCSISRFYSLLHVSLYRDCNRTFAKVLFRSSYTNLFYCKVYRLYFYDQRFRQCIRSKQRCYCTRCVLNFR